MSLPQANESSDRNKAEVIEQEETADMLVADNLTPSIALSSTTWLGAEQISENVQLIILYLPLHTITASPHNLLTMQSLAVRENLLQDLKFHRHSIDFSLRFHPNSHLM